MTRKLTEACGYTTQCPCHSNNRDHVRHVFLR